MKRLINLAIISPSNNAYSETFIQAHKKINANIFFYYNGYLPSSLENKGKIVTRGARYAIYILKKTLLRKSRFSFAELCLIDSFKKNSIQCVLAEFGPTGCHILNVCRYLKIPIVSHFHGFDVCRHDAIVQYQDLYLKLFEYSSKIIAVSNEMVHDLIKIGADKSKIIKLTYAPNSKFLNENVSESLDIEFVYVGRFVEKKAPHLLIYLFKEVFDKYPNIKLKMIGDGPLLGVCKDLAQVLKIKNILFLGVLKPEDILIQLKKSFCFIQHNVTADNGDKEGTPVSILEAMAIGLPVLSTRHAGIRDIVLDGINGYLVDERDVNAMLKNILYLIENPKLASTMGIKSKEIIKQNYNETQYFNELNSIIYNSIKHLDF